jgi:hypothetical protein
MEQGRPAPGEFLPPSQANFLCKTLPKVATEMVRCALTCNLTRLLNIVDVEPSGPLFAQ